MNKINHISPCTGCGGDYTRHLAVDVHVRTVEDAETMSHRAYGVGEPVTQNPSSRRDGLVIVLGCENCSQITHLSISQHKGVTYIESEPAIENNGPEDAAVSYFRKPWNVIDDAADDKRPVGFDNWKTVGEALPEFKAPTDD